MDYYKSLNDAKLPSLAKGTTRIWYRTRTSWEKNIFSIDPNAPTKTHALLGEVASTDLEQLFHDLQGEVWSPTGEARPLIVAKGLDHTSMSMGDAVEIDGKFHIVSAVGFTEANVRLGMRLDKCSIEEGVTLIMQHQLDVSDPESVQVLVNHRTRVLHVNVNGVMLLRISRCQHLECDEIAEG